MRRLPTSRIERRTRAAIRTYDSYLSFSRFVRQGGLPPHHHPSLARKARRMGCIMSPLPPLPGFVGRKGVNTNGPTVARQIEGNVGVSSI